MMKRTAALFLLAAMLGANLASCGGTSPSGSDTSDPSGAVTAAPVAETSIYDTLPKMDLNGMEIRIFGYRASHSYNDAEFYTAEQTGEVIDDALYLRNIETEQHLNIKITYNTPDDENAATTNFTNSVMAGDDMCDLFIHKCGRFNTHLASGTLMPWNDIKGVDLDRPWFIQDANETIRVGGMQYGLFSDANATNITMVWTTVFNKRLANEWKIEDPYKIVDEGKWTMDKLISLTKDVYVDVNGNNEKDREDTYGYYTDNGATIDAFMVAHDIGAVKKDADDFLQVDFYSERVVKSFEKIYELYWDNPGTFVDQTEPYVYRINFANGQGLFSPMLFNYLIGTDLRSMADDYGVLPYPKLDEDQDYHTYLLARCGIYMLPITLTEQKKDVIGYVVDVLSGYSYKYLRPAIYDVSLTEKGVRDEDSVRMLELMMDTRTYDFSSFLEKGGQFAFCPATCYRNQLAKKDMNITSYYDSKKVAAQEYLDTLNQAVKDAIK